ncbi:hypothetical protein [Anseongella ginsenosidimutans]|nr:hypothetical protein [Anseongella ginsenosidimutans]
MIIRNKRMRKGFGLLIIFILLAAGAEGQQAGNARLASYQDTLASLGKKIMTSSFSPERIEANYQFIKILVEALQEPDSYSFGFDSVKNMRILYADDNSFRIMSWYVDRGNSSQRFYGAIQMNEPELKLFGLVDHASEFHRPEDTVSSYESWYGAYYYRIIPVKAGEQKYHVLLGWSGGSPAVSRRVIDVLHFRQGKPVFGMPVFHTKEGVKNRILFQYSSKASMMLDYLPEKKTIIFDHLVPFSEGQKGNYEFYGPDLSYDGFALQNGQWHLTEDLELQNDRNNLDKFFNDPEKMRDAPASKLPEDN